MEPACAPGALLGLCALPLQVRRVIGQLVGCRLRAEPHPAAALIKACRFEAGVELEVFCKGAYSRWEEANCPGPCRPRRLWPRRVPIVRTPPAQRVKLFALRLTPLLSIRAAQIVIAPRILRPTGSPPEILRRCGPRLAFDVKVHNWAQSEPGRAMRGPHGHFWFPAPDGLAPRILQLAWCSGDALEVRTLRHSADVLAAARPSVLAEMTPQEVEAAVPPQRALEDFLAAVHQALSVGGFIISHHLEQDAEAVATELALAGLPTATWEAAVHRGCCLMSPALGRWLRACAGETLPPSALPCLALRELCHRLLGNPSAAQSNSPGSRAALHLRLFNAAAALAA
jgi:hypothetical protein